MSGRSIINGSLTHVRYCHRTRPKLLEVICPSCKGLATARQRSETAEEEGVVVMDLSPSFGLDDWMVACSNCMKRYSDLSYKELPPLFYSGGELDVWAWNSDHLHCIVDSLNGLDTSENYYHWFMAYLHGSWKKKPEKAIKSLKLMYNNRKQPNRESM